MSHRLNSDLELKSEEAEKNNQSKDNTNKKKPAVSSGKLPWTEKEHSANEIITTELKLKSSSPKNQFGSPREKVPDNLARQKFLELKRLRDSISNKHFEDKVQQKFPFESPRYRLLEY